MGNFLATWESFLALLNSSDDRDIALGQFMYEWGNLESKLFFLFYILIGASPEIAQIIFSTGFRSATLSNLFIALGKIRLTETEQGTLKGLCKKYREAADKRNRIVHGAWEMDQTDNPKVLQWTRIYTPTNPGRENEISNHNQEIRAKHRFTIKKLIASTDQIKSLKDDVWQFTLIIMNRLYPDDKLP